VGSSDLSRILVFISARSIQDCKFAKRKKENTGRNYVHSGMDYTLLIDELQIN
jgi:hypothetical protein